MSRYQCPSPTCRAQWDADDGGLACPVCATSGGILVVLLEERTTEPVPEVEVGLPDVEPAGLRLHPIGALPHPAVFPTTAEGVSVSESAAVIAPESAPAGHTSGLLGTVGRVLSYVLPIATPVLAVLGGPVAGAVGAALSGLAGLTRAQPAPVQGSLVKYGPLAALAGTVGYALVDMALQMPEAGDLKQTALRTALLVVGAGCCVLAGKALPTPLAKR